MRRSGGGDGIDRADGDPFRPNESDKRHEPQAARTLPAATLSRWLFPQRLHQRAVSVRVRTPSDVFKRGELIPVRIELRNPMPFPVTIRTRSPVPWTWHVDGHRDASHVPEPLPDEETEFTLKRGERRRFQRNWSQSFKTSETRWEPAQPGEYTIGVGLTVTEPADRGLYDETTVRIE